MVTVRFLPTHLCHCVTLNIVFETLKLQMEHGRERLEKYSLFRILQTKSFGLILVLTLHHFNRNIVSERLVKVFHPLDVQRDVCEEC